MESRIPSVGPKWPGKQVLPAAKWAQLLLMRLITPSAIVLPKRFHPTEAT